MKKISKFIMGMIAMAALCAGVTACNPNVPEEETQGTTTELISESVSTRAWEGVVIEAAAFADIKIGDQILISYGINTDGEAGYNMFQIQKGTEDGFETIEEVTGLVSAGSYKYTFKSQEIIDSFKAFGFKTQGNNITYNKITLIQYDAE